MAMLISSSGASQSSVKYPGTFMKICSRLVKNDPLLKEVDLRRFNLRVNGADELANALSLNETATSLCLWLNHMGDEVTGKAVVHCVLVVVTQSHCFLRQGIEVLAPSLASHPCLVKIDLFDNNIGDAGAAALAQVLIQSSTIQVINLQENMIGDQGAHILIQSTACFSGGFATVMAVLCGEHSQPCTAHNASKFAGAFALAAALQSNGSLERLGLEKNKISDDGAAALATALEHNVVLTDVSLAENSNILDDVALNKLNQLVCRNQATKRREEEIEVASAAMRDEAFPIHSDSQAKDLTLLAGCIAASDSSVVPGFTSIVLGLCEDNTTASRVDLQPALCGDRADVFGAVEHHSVAMETGWVGNRKG